MRSFLYGISRLNVVVIVGTFACVCCLCAPTVSAADATDQEVIGKQLTIFRDEEHVLVEQDDQLLIRYRYQGASHKPYVDRLTSPNGVNVLRDAPSDHLHHHGLMFAVAVDGVNFWEEGPISGREVHVEWRELRIATVRTANGSERRSVEQAILRQHLRWEGPDAAVLLEEDRVMTVPATPKGEPCVITWQSTFTAPNNGREVILSGSSYFGLGARFLETMDSGGHFQNSSGDTGVEQTNTKRSTWCAYTASPRPDEPVTVAMFDPPGNLRHPATWFTMDEPFAYLSATLGVDVEPVKLKPSQKLTLRYGVAVFDGAVDKKTLDSKYALWQQVPIEVRSGSARGLIGRYYSGLATGRPVAARIDESVAFDWSDGMPDNRLPAGPFSVAWEGEVFVQSDGQFRFFADAEGEVRVWVDDEEVYQSGEQIEKPIALEHGFHSLRVSYSATGQHPRVKLLWQSNYFPREVISARYLVHPLAFEVDVAAALRYQQGRELVERYACARCHALTGVPAIAQPGPPLNRTERIDADYLARWIRDPQSVRPGSRMPSVRQLQDSTITNAEADVKAIDVKAITAFLQSLPLDPATADRLAKKDLDRQKDASSLPTGSLNGGRKLFHTLGCVACHAPETPNDAEPGEAPSLADVGAKWPRDELHRFLEDPLLWRPDGRMPDFKLTEMEAADLAAYLTTFRPAADETQLADAATHPKQPTHDANLVARGKQLVEQLQCAACHDIAGIPSPAPKPLPHDGSTTIAGTGCLEDPASRLHFNLTEETRIAIREFLSHRPNAASQLASQEIAEKQMRSHFQCFRCHTRDGFGGQLLSKALLRHLGRKPTDTTAATEPPRTSAAALSPPDLSGVGAKLRPEWLHKVLADTAPGPRPWMTMRMPRFAMSDTEQKNLVDRLVSADSIPELDEPPTAEHLPADLESAAVSLMGSKAFSCTHCHYLGQHHPGGDTIAPDLSMVSQRISRAWFFRWLNNPARVRPGTPMPAYVQPAAGIAGGDLATQKETLWTYLSTTPPDKMVLAAEPVRMVTVDGPNPRVVQGRVLGEPPLNAARAVAIGFPDGNSVLFDGGRLAWLGHWNGDFLREVGGHGARHHWVPASTTFGTSHQAIQDSVSPSASRPPVFFREKNTGRWLAPQAWRDRFGWLDKISLEGRSVQLEYRLRVPGTRNADEAEAGPWVRVTELVEPNPPGDTASGFTRQLHVTGLPAQYDVVIDLPFTAANGSLTISDVAISSVQDLGILPVSTHPMLVARETPSAKSNEASTRSAMHVVRLSGDAAARWIRAPSTISHPVLQPFTDEPIEAGQQFDSTTVAGQNRIAVLIPNGGDGTPLQLTVQTSRFETETTIASGPPRRWQTPADASGLVVSATTAQPASPPPSKLHAKLSPSDGVTLPTGFRCQRLPLPEDLLVCGVTFWNGKLLAGGYDGEIHIADDTDGDGLQDRYRAFAGTFDQINNLRTFDDQLYAATPGAVYRITDRDGDELADAFNILSSAWDWAGHRFDWFFGLARDEHGNLYGGTSTAYERPSDIPGLHLRGSVLRITPEGRTVKIGDGIRYNFGWASNQAGRIYFNVNQGHWNITCSIHQVAEGDHYGYGEPDQSKVKKPVVHIPYPWCRSLTGLVFAERQTPFGPFQNHGFAADYNTRRIVRWTEQQVGSQRQGACYPFLDGLDAGPTDMVFGSDGALYVGYMSDGAWYPERPRGGIYKITYEGPTPFSIREGRVTSDGFEIELTTPVDPESVNAGTCRRVHRYFHEYKGIYHSDEIAHEDVAVHDVSVLRDGRTLKLRTDPHLTPRIYRVQLRGLRSTTGQSLESGEIYLTLYAIPK